MLIIVSASTFLDSDEYIKPMFWPLVHVPLRRTGVTGGWLDIRSH